jgi:predicted  nucleic acid-binding Zn-ribbon protein
MQEGFFHTFLAKVLDACIMPVNSCFSASYASLVEQMTIALPLCDSLRGKILLVASASEMQDKIWKLLQFQFEEKHSDCRAYTASLHQHMMSATIALLLNLAITTQTPGPSLPVQLATALINKQRQLQLIATRCSHEMATTKPAVVSLFQQKSTPYTGQHLQDWRERLNSDIENHATFQRDSIVRSVAQICQDLEARCNTVEEPLRRERQKTKELQQHVAQLNERISSLKVQADDDRCYLDGLEDEKNTILEENDGLSAKLNDLQAKFEEASRNADETLRRVREDFNAKELELRSTLLSCEETIHTHEEKSEAQIRMVRNLEHDLGQAQDERASLGEQIETLQRQLEDAEKKLESETENGRTQSEEATRLSNRHIELELQLQGTEAELDAITTRLSDLQVSYRELVDSSEDAYKDLEHKHVRDMEAATVQERDDRAKLDAKLQEALHNGQRAEDAYEETRRDLQKLQASVPPLEERIQELIDICSEQEEELEELRTLRKNVLAQLTVQPTANRSASRGPTDSDGPRPHRAPREHRRRKSALQDPDTVPKGSRSTQNAASTEENVVNASFASSDSYSSQNGSTPKRLKPRQSFKVPAMHTPHNQKPLFGSRSTSKKLSPTKRSALRQLSPNRRHTVGFAVPENEEEQPNILRSGRKRRGSLRDVEEADFEMEDFLAGTPLTPGNFVSGTGRIPNDDEATATEL